MHKEGVRDWLAVGGWSLYFRPHLPSSKITFDKICISRGRLLLQKLPFPGPTPSDKVVQRNPRCTVGTQVALQGTSDGDPVFQAVLLLWLLQTVQVSEGRDDVERLPEALNVFTWMSQNHFYPCLFS